MSGVEIAGLLLGSFPLLISALEHYRETAEVLEDWWQIKKEYKKCKNEIKLQELAFESNLERFLLPLLVDDDQIKSLIAEPGGTLWKDHALEITLRSRLPKSYDLFLDIIGDIQDIMNGLRVELGLGKVDFQKGLHANVTETNVKKSRSPLRSLIKREKHSTRVPVNSTTTSERSWKKWLSRPNIEYQTQRVKFGFGRANRTKLFEQFARSNGRLRELLDTSEKSAALKQARDRSKKTMLTKAMCSLWRHATSLHGLLEQAWGCQCKHMHRIHLLLYSRANVEQIEYSVCFMYTLSTLPSCPWTCMEVAVQHLEKKTLVLPPLGTMHPKTSMPASPINPSSLASKAPNLTSKSALRSHTTSRLPSHQRVNWKDSSKPSTTAAKVPQETKHEIRELCSSIANCGSIATCLGTLEGDEGSYLLNHNGQPCDDLHDSMSLETLLQGRSGVTLDRRQRYTIAFMLVSSHLQLYPSPWLSYQWSKKDIIFVKHRGDPLSIKLDKPYMRRDATPPPSNQPSSYATKDRLLPTLGILLIELCFGTALEDHEMRKKCQTSHTGGSANADLEAALDLGVALEWSRSVGGEAGERYADAVQWCLKGQATGAKDDRWREELYKNVVSPLQFCYEQFSPPI